MIIRECDDVYKCVHNIMLTSKMSLGAKGLITYLLTEKPDTYELSLHDLAISHCCSQQWLEKIIGELQQFGYIEYEMISNGGKIDGNFIIYDTPHEISMIRYDYTQDFIKSANKAEKTFIKTYLNSNRHKKRDRKISTLMEEIQEYVVDWDYIYQYISGEMNYVEFLNSDYWLIISQYLKQKANFTCVDCGQQFFVFGKLNVHHLTYENHGKEHLPEVQENDLVVLCDECHEKRHKDMPQFEQII